MWGAWQGKRPESRVLSEATQGRVEIGRAGDADVRSWERDLGIWGLWSERGKFSVQHSVSISRGLRVGTGGRAVRAASAGAGSTASVEGWALGSELPVGVRVLSELRAVVGAPCCRSALVMAGEPVLISGTVDPFLSVGHPLTPVLTCLPEMGRSCTSRPSPCPGVHPLSGVQSHQDASQGCWMLGRGAAGTWVGGSQPPSESTILSVVPKRRPPGLQGPPGLQLRPAPVGAAV